jgi:hypothetical protein
MPAYATLAKIVVPVAIFALGWLVYGAPYNNWNRFYYLALAFAFTVYLAAVLRGRLRNAAVTAAAIAFSLSVAEGYAIATEARPIDTNTSGYSASRPILGWGPEFPGVFRHTKTDAKTGRVIFAVDYTVDAHRNRQVISAEAGPTVAFFGDSMTYGTGLPDAETLPQVFADATGRALRVLNLGFPGYGPQQFLRALETGMFDDLLQQPRLFVYQTVPWHTERSSCLTGYMLRAPRYVLVDGQPVFQGPCYADWKILLRGAVAGTALYRVFVNPARDGVGPADIELYIATVIRAGQIAREKYGVPTAILMLPGVKGYLNNAGITEPQLMQRLRAGGLIVIDGALDPLAVPGQPLNIQGDGHPTGVANRARAALVRDFLPSVPAQTR